MAKIAFSKLNIKKNDTVKTVNVNGVDIDVVQYLPINDKLDLIGKVISGAYDGTNNFVNPVMIEVLGTLEIIYAYTNLSFTEKQREDFVKLYDLMEGNGLIDTIIDAIPAEEYATLIQGIDETARAFYNYKTSALGILESVSSDYSNLNLDASNIQKTLADPKNLELLKNVLTKMG